MEILVSGYTKLIKCFYNMSLTMSVAVLERKLHDPFPPNSLKSYKLNLL